MAANIGQAIVLEDMVNIAEDLGSVNTAANLKMINLPQIEMILGIEVGTPSKGGVLCFKSFTALTAHDRHRSGAMDTF